MYPCQKTKQNRRHASSNIHGKTCRNVHEKQLNLLTVIVEKSIPKVEAKASVVPARFQKAPEEYFCTMLFDKLAFVLIGGRRVARGGVFIIGLTRPRGSIRISTTF